MSGDRAGQSYWEGLWAAGRIPEAIDPSRRQLANYANRCFHEFFRSSFACTPTHKMALLEIGCAASGWLPYFAQQFGFEVYGLDYSPAGCDLARRILQRADVSGEVVHGDLFSPPQDLFGKFHVVVSFGVAEHFTDTGAFVVAASRLLRHDGMLVTLIPNMLGLNGWLQRLLDRETFEKHVPLSSEELARAHALAGLQVLSCNYLMSSNFAVCNINSVTPRTISWGAKKVAIALLARVSMCVWALEIALGSFRPNKCTSPYIACVARNPAGRLAEAIS